MLLLLPMAEGFLPVLIASVPGFVFMVAPEKAA